MSRSRTQESLSVMAAKTALVLVTALVCTLPAHGVEPGSEPPVPLRVVFSESMFANVNPNDAKASAKAWGQQVAEDMGVNVILETWVEDDLAVIREDILNQRIEMVAITSQEYLVLEADVPVGPLLVGAQAGKPTQEYLLLVASDGAVKTLADLRGKALLSYTDPMACFAERWLELVLRGDHQAGLSSFFSIITPCPELTSSVLPVFFGQADACLVTRAGYETMVELNPQVGRSLRVLASSPPVVPMVVFVRGDFRPDLRDRAVNAMLRVNESASGRQLLTLFRSTGLCLPPDGLLDTARALAAGQLPSPASAALAQEPTGMD